MAHAPSKAVWHWRPSPAWSKPAVCATLPPALPASGDRGTTLGAGVSPLAARAGGGLRGVNGYNGAASLGVF